MMKNVYDFKLFSEHSILNKKEMLKKIKSTLCIVSFFTVLNLFLKSSVNLNLRPGSVRLFRFVALFQLAHVLVLSVFICCQG